MGHYTAADSDHLRTGTVMDEQAVYLADAGDARLFAPPSGPLHENVVAVLAQYQLDAAVGNTVVVLFDGVALP